MVMVMAGDLEVRRVELGDGAWIASHERGDPAGARVLLLHSGGMSSRQWRKLSHALAPAYRTLVPDLLGYGLSSPVAAGARFHFRQDLEAVRRLVVGGPPAHVVGHSYGGLLALQLALAEPGAVLSIAAYEPVAFGVLDARADADARAGLYSPTEFDGEPWLERFVDWWNGPGAWRGMAPQARAAFLAAGWKLSQEVLSLSSDRTDRATYGRIQVPTLLLGGEHTPLTERRVLDNLAAALPAATLRRFPGLGHMGPITHAAQVNAAIVDHLAAVAAASSTRS